jgi:hypothetical protein
VNGKPVEEKDLEYIEKILKFPFPLMRFPDFLDLINRDVYDFESLTTLIFPYVLPILDSLQVASKFINPTSTTLNEVFFRITNKLKGLFLVVGKKYSL